MKLCGIIAEFNPLTNGHDYFLKQVKKQTNANIAVIMSGNFTQRGEMAILDKYERASHAIVSGADIVLELPECFALSSAPFFALGGVKILSDLGIDSLAFGVKVKETSSLIKIAKLKCQEDKKISNMIVSFMKMGQSYSMALLQTYKQAYPSLQSEIDEIFSEPNNILAIEYLSAIYKHNLNIQPVFINREDSGYNTNKIKRVRIFGKTKYLVNATFIRSLAYSGKTKKTKRLVPSHVFESLKNRTFSNEAQIKLDAFVLKHLRDLSTKELETFADYNTALSHLVKNNSNLYSSQKQICNAFSSKCYRKSRIAKLLLLPLFNVKKDFSKALFKPYAINVLAVNASKKKWLSELIKTSKSELIVSLSDLEKLEQEKAIFVLQNQTGSNIYNICNNRKQATDKTIFVVQNR